MSESRAYIYEFDSFRLEAAERRLFKDGEPVTLPSKALDLLIALVENNGHLVDKDTLYDRVWADSIVEDANLTVQMSAIRKALGNPDYIKTVKGHGYRFSADVREVNGAVDEYVFESQSFARIVVEQETGQDFSESVQANTALTASKESRPFFSRIRNWQIAAAVLAIAATLGLVGYLWQGESQPSTNLSGLPAMFPSASIKRLTTSGNASTATLSPDGKLFVYTLNEKGRKSLWLGHTNGGEPVLLRPAAEVSYDSLRFAPDGGSFYYVLTELRKFRGDLYRSPIFGGVPEKLRDDVPAAISFAPDFKQFAFVRNDRENGRSSIIITDLAGNMTRELAARPLAGAFNSRSLSWSPDGRMIAASATGDDETSSEIFAVTVADGQAKQLTALAWNLVRATTWLKDGSGFVIVGQDKNSYDAWQLWQISAVTGEARQLNPDLNTYGSALSLSADNGALLAVQAQGMPNVWVAPAEDLSRARQITFGTFGRRDGWVNLDWMPDGKLLYGAYVGKSLTIWSMDADGGNQKQMTSAGFLDQQLSVTADGGTIVFQSNRSGNDEIWRMNSDGGDLRQLTAGGSNIEPHAAPDGKWIVYRGSDKLLWRMNIDGGEAARLTEKVISDPRISPNGKLIACGYETDGKIMLAVLSNEGGEPLRSFDVPSTANFRYGIRWTTDGSSVTYRDWYNGIWKQPLAGGEPERLKGLPEEKLYAYEWSRNGKGFAFVRGAEIRDVVLLTGSE